MAIPKAATPEPEGPALDRVARPWGCGVAVGVGVAVAVALTCGQKPHHGPQCFSKSVLPRSGVAVAGVWPSPRRLGMRSATPAVTRSRPGWPRRYRRPSPSAARLCGVEGLASCVRGRELTAQVVNDELLLERRLGCLGGRLLGRKSRRSCCGRRAGRRRRHRGNGGRAVVVSVVLRGGVVVRVVICLGMGVRVGCCIGCASAASTAALTRGLLWAAAVGWARRWCRERSSGSGWAARRRMPRWPRR